MSRTDGEEGSHNFDMGSSKTFLTNTTYTPDLTSDTYTTPTTPIGRSLYMSNTLSGGFPLTF